MSTRTFLPASLALGLAAAAAIGCTPKPTPGAHATSNECHLEWKAEPVAQVEKPQIVAPFSLTASDGTGLEIVAVDARAVVEDPLAFTELRLTFRNPEPRQIEGRFEINLPPGSAISRFAMKIGDRWQEAEVVELQAARRAYEDFLHRRQDPALLEKNAGNTFSARVFPIPANGVKEIIVSYSEELPAMGEPYTLLLRGLPELQNLDVDVIVPRRDGPHHTRMRKQRFTPQSDLELKVDARPVEVGLRYERLAVARVAPAVDVAQEPLKGMTLLFDTSASRALDFKGQVARLGQIVAELKAQNGDFDLRVLAFDQEVVPVFSGPASSFTGDAQQQLLRRGALGASDLSGALEWVAGHPNGHARVLVVSDGIVTAGDSEAEDVRKAANALGKGGVTRVDAIVDGGIQDALLLRQLTTADLAKAGIVADADKAPKEVASRILRATLADVKVEVPGAAWVWPQTLDSVQPGDTFLVFADLPKDKEMEVALGDGRSDVHKVELKTSERPLLERAWIKASIDRLTAMMAKEAAGDDAKKTELRNQIIELSTRYRVLSDYTALLVLETEWDYQRFGIDRRGLAEIITVRGDGIDVIDRTQLPGKDGQPMIVDDIDEVREVVAEKQEASFLDQLFGDGDGGASATKAGRAAPAPMDAPEEEADADDEAGGQGTRHRGEEGKMGRPSPKASAAALAEPMPEPEPAPNDGIALNGALGGGSAEAAVDFGGEDRKEEAPREKAKKRATTGSSSSTPRPQTKADARRSRQPARDIESEIAALSDRPAPPPSPGALLDPSPASQRQFMPRPQPTWERPKEADPYDGRFADVMRKLAADDVQGGLAEAWRWRHENPGDELAILALGEAAEAGGDRTLAARAYGSLIDLFPGRADIRRMAGERLEALGAPGLELAVDTFAQAVEQRPDHPSSHRLYAFALLKAGKPAEAFAAALAGSRQSYPWGRFRGVPQILQEDLRLIAAAWLAQKPGDKEAIQIELAKAGVTPDTQPSLRFVLNWETDANDVDFHIYDGQGGHAYYSQKHLSSGGSLYADVTTGYGPECFTVWGKASGFPYDLQAHYYSRGPMGYGMGKLEVIEHDGKGNLLFAENPFVIMKDRAYVDLGRIERPLRELDLAIPRLDVGAAKGGGDYAPPAPSGYAPPPPGGLAAPPSGGAPPAPTRF
ncbi:MAG: VIT domain-containing protein [Nannocystaceae bacterium]